MLFIIIYLWLNLKLELNEYKNIWLLVKEYMKIEAEKTLIRARVCEKCWVTRFWMILWLDFCASIFGFSSHIPSYSLFLRFIQIKHFLHKHQIQWSNDPVESCLRIWHIDKNCYEWVFLVLLFYYSLYNELIDNKNILGNYFQRKHYNLLLIQHTIDSVSSLTHVSSRIDPKKARRKLGAKVL